ncbi:hypothetical protein J1605_021135 [Eschrichtius robustus]|uniref:Uncharacterized protein n=1 Tax=Eschrichtius robustus TaxID=9764 RepID=A0AB34HH13_ESCRO|nr:hypothetical protein J1605_021135 [Eschrichtius robustus]
MLGSQGHIHTPLTSGTLEIAIRPIHHLPPLPFLQAPFPLPQEHPRGIQPFPLVGPVILCHNQGIQDANPQVPTPLHTHHLPLAYVL